MKVWALSLALVCSTALATNKPSTPAPSSNSDAVSLGVGIGGDSNAKAQSNSASNSVAGAAADSASQSVSASSVTSTNHNTVAGGEGGAARARAVAGDSTATSGDSNSSADNALSLTQNYHHERSAPSVVQGSIYAGQCVSAGNAGGSNTGGSAFLGLSFTPYECHLARQAAAYEAAGDPVTACEIRRRSPSMQRLKKDTGYEPPPCYPKVPAPPVMQVSPDPIDTSKFVTRDELAEHERRIVTAVAGK
jgi:hypothetical protein